MPHEDRDMRRRRLCDPGGRDESDAAASQGTPWVDSDHWKLGRGKEGFQLETQRDHGPANTLISDISPQTMREQISAVSHPACSTSS